MLHILAREPAFATLAVVEVMAAGPRALRRRRALLAGFAAPFAEAPPPPVDPAGTAGRGAGRGGWRLRRDLRSRGGRPGRQLPERLPELSYFALSPFVGAARATAVAPLLARDLVVD